MPPDSVFSRAADFPQLKPPSELEMNLNSRVELPGLRYIPSNPGQRRAARRADAIAALGEYQWA